MLLCFSCSCVVYTKLSQTSKACSLTTTTPADRYVALDHFKLSQMNSVNESLLWVQVLIENDGDIRHAVQSMGNKLKIHTTVAPERGYIAAADMAQRGPSRSQSVPPTVSMK